MGSLDSEDRDRDREITDRVAADQGGADRIAELEARIDELEERLTRSAWSRRGILGLLGIGGVASLSGNAAAGSAQVGTIGTQNKPVDIEAEDINAAQIGTSSNRPDIFADTLDFNSAAGLNIDVIAEIDGKQITPSQVGTSSKRATVIADSVTESGNNVVTSPNADRDIYVIPNGGSTPSAADADDIILEKK